MENQDVGHPAPRATDPLPELEREFIQRLKAAGKSVNTVKNYCTDLQCFKQYLEERQNTQDINDFGLQKVREYGEYVKERYSSDNSRRRRVQALRIFFDFLVDKKIYSENPVRKIAPSPKFLDIPRPPSLSNIQKLWNYLIQQGKRSPPLERVTGARNQLVFILIYTGGLKVSDLAKLKEDHVDNSPGEPRVLVVPRKRDPYSIPLHPVFNHIYDNYQTHLNRAKTLGGMEFSELFFNANPFKILNGGLSTRGLELIFEEFRTRLDIQVTPKSLRQAAIFNWLGKNHSEGLIKEWLGVAPSYTLKPYRDHIRQHPYNDEFFLYTKEKTLH